MSRGPRARAWLLALLLGACSSKASSKGAEPPSEPGAGGGEGGAAAPGDAEKSAAPTTAEPGDALPDLDARVEAAWVELRALDEAREEAAASDPGAAAARCDRIRGLANEICTLSDRMCTLADEHRGDARYADACARSGETCRSARAAADRCPAA